MRSVVRLYLGPSDIAKGKSKGNNQRRLFEAQLELALALSNPSLYSTVTDGYVKAVLTDRSSVADSIKKKIPEELTGL